MIELSTLHYALAVEGGTSTPFERLDRLRREVHPDSPSGAPVLHLRRGRDGHAALFTEGQAVGAPLDAAVWLGRRIDVPGATPRASLVGTSSSGLALAAELVATATIVARDSGIEWVRHQGRWNARPVGQVLLVVEDPIAGGELFLTGPELVDAHARASRVISARARGPRPVDRLGPRAFAELAGAAGPKRFVDPTVR